MRNRRCKLKLSLPLQGGVFFPKPNQVIINTLGIKQIDNLLKKTGQIGQVRLVHRVPYQFPD